MDSWCFRPRLPQNTWPDTHHLIVFSHMVEFFFYLKIPMTKCPMICKHSNRIKWKPRIISANQINDAYHFFYIGSFIKVAIVAVYHKQLSCWPWISPPSPIVTLLEVLRWSKRLTLAPRREKRRNIEGGNKNQKTKKKTLGDWRNDHKKQVRQGMLNSKSHSVRDTKTNRRSKEEPCLRSWR